MTSKPAERKTMRGPRVATGGIGEDTTRAQFVDDIGQLSRGNATAEEFERVLIHLMDRVGFYRPPRLADWVKAGNSADTYQVHCIQHIARCEVLEIILDALNMSDERKIALERAVIRERELKRR